MIVIEKDNWKLKKRFSYIEPKSLNEMVSLVCHLLLELGSPKEAP